MSGIVYKYILKIINPLDDNKILFEKKYTKLQEIATDLDISYHQVLCIKTNKSKYNKFTKIEYYNEK